MPSLTLQHVMDELYLRIRAGFPLIFIESREELRVLRFLTRIVRVLRSQNPQKRMVRWTQGVGLEELVVDHQGLPAHDVKEEPIPWLELGAIPARAIWEVRNNRVDADEALRLIRNAGRSAGMDRNPVYEDCVAIFFDIHKRITNDLLSSDLVRPLRTTYNECRMFYEKQHSDQSRPDAGAGGSSPVYKTVIIVGPSAAMLSSELEGDLSVITFPLPDSKELGTALKRMLTHKRLHIPTTPSDDDLKKVLGTAGISNPALKQTYADRLADQIANSGRGLPWDAFAFGLNCFAVRNSQLTPEHIEMMLGIKSDAVANMPALEYHPQVDVNLGGLEEIKSWAEVRIGAVTSQTVREQYKLPSLKGMLLCGVAGGGKSQLARYMARAFNLALLRLDVGALFGSYIGESERRTREALQLAEALAPVVLWIDEIDKAFKGTGGGGDSGVSSRVIGHILTWLAEKQDSVFVVATANDFRDLLGRFPELSRRGRFDLIYWVGLPDEAAREDIFRIYVRPLLRHQAVPGQPAYLQITHDDVELLAAEHHVPLPKADDPFSRFCKLLSHDNISLHLTGAEIEAAINDAKFEAFDKDRGHGKFDTLTPWRICRTVIRVKEQGLYRTGAPDEILLKELEREASSRGWMGAHVTTHAAGAEEPLNSWSETTQSTPADFSQDMEEMAFPADDQ